MFGGRIVTYILEVIVSCCDRGIFVVFDLCNSS